MQLTKRISIFLAAMCAVMLIVLGTVSVKPKAAYAADGDNIEKIEKFTGALIKGADNENGKWVWTPTNANNDHKFVYRLTYAFSGVKDLPAKAVAITVPKHILKDRNGSYADEIDAAAVDESEADANDKWVIKQDPDHDNQMIIYNNQAITAADAGDIEVAYATTENTYDYIDMEKSDDWQASIKVTNGDVTQTAQTDKIPVYINTGVEITSTSKRIPEGHFYKEWRSEWGNKPSDADDYYYLSWEVKSTIKDKSTQPYNFTLNDTFRNGSVVAYKMEGRGGWSTSNTVKNINPSGGFNERYDYVLTRHKKSDYTQNKYTVHNDVTAVVDPIDQVDPDTKASASAEWTYEKPFFIVPIGHFWAEKYGLALGIEKDATYGSHHIEDYILSGMSDNVTGKYFALDSEDIADYSLGDFEKGTAKSLDQFSYVTYVRGFPYPWTVKSGQSMQNPDNYGKKDVKYELIDDKLSLDNLKGGTLDLSASDYDFTSLIVNTDASNATFNDDTQKFEPTSANEKSDFTSSDVLSIYVKHDGGNWVKATDYNYATGTFSNVNSTYVDTTRANSATKQTIKFKDGVDGYKLVTQNHRWFTQLNAYPTVSLKGTSKVLSTCGDKTKVGLVNNSTGNTYEYNDSTNAFNATPLFTRSISAKDYAQKIVPESQIEKYVTGTRNNKKKKQYTVSWRVDMAETYRDNDGRHQITQNGGTFYDLCPSGSAPDLDSVEIKSGSTIIDPSDYKVSTIEDYKGSGRTLLKVEIKPKGTAYSLTFDTVHTWENLRDLSFDIYNSAVYETGNSEIADGFPDDGGSGNDKAILTDLDKATNAKRFLYSQDWHTANLVTSASTGLKKQVKAREDSDYSYDTITYPDDSYSYKIRLANDGSTKTKGIIFFDSLENYKTPSGKTSDWHGTLKRIDTSLLESKGIQPVVYYTSEDNIDIYAHHDLAEVNSKGDKIWKTASEFGDISKAKGFAIDATTNKDGSPFVLDKSGSVQATVFMQSPKEAPATIKEGIAYNNIFVNETTVKENGGEDRSLIHQDYTQIKYRVAGDLSFKKVSAKNQNSAISGISFRLYGTSDYGDNIDVTASSGSNGTVNFKKIFKGTYKLQELGGSDDWLVDHNTYTVSIDQTGNASITGLSKITGEYLFPDKPRIHSSIKISKLGTIFANRGVPNTTFKLTGTSDYGTEVSEKVTSGINGSLVFQNIEKGTYQLVETQANGDYVRDSATYKVIVDSDANVSVYDSNNKALSTSGQSAVIRNEERYHYFKIKKVDADSKDVLSGATFKLTGVSDLGTNVNQVVTTGSDGIASFLDVEKGQYVLKETVAPALHKLDTTQRIVTVAGNGSVTITGLAESSDHTFELSDEKSHDGKITVTKVWKSDGKTNDQRSVPKIHISTKNPNAQATTQSVKAKAQSVNTAKRQTAKLSEIKKDESQKIHDKKNAQSAPTISKNDLLQEAKTKNSHVNRIKAKLQGTVTHQNVTYHANDGTFSNGSKTNVVGYDFDPGSPTTVTKYSHTANIDDSGAANGTYANNLSTTDTVTIPGATKLTIDVYYSTEATNFDWLAIYPKGITPSRSNYDQASISGGKLGGGSKTSKSDTTHAQFVVDGDTAQFYFKSDNSSAYYGYYAIVTNGLPKSASITSGTVSKPTPSSKDIVFDAWYTDQACTKKWDGVSQVSNLYAGYKKWYLDYKYDKDDSNRTIILTKYIGNDTDLYVPSKVTIDGITYQVVVGTKMSGAKSNTYSGTNIQSIKFEDGVKTTKYLQYLFADCENLKTIDCKRIDTSNVTNMGGMFVRCSSLTSLDVSNWGNSNVTNMDQMFADCSSLTSLDVSSWDTSKVTNMSCMFYNCSRLTSLDVSNFNTSNVTNMNSMFKYCRSLTSLDVSSWDTSKVTHMDSMFGGCSNLTSIDVSNWDTSKVTDMRDMFGGCSNLTSIDVSNWDTSKVTNMRSMFASCSSLTTLDLSNFNTSNVTGMSNMFFGCSSLTSLDVSNFNTSNVTDMYYMFGSCYGLTSLDLSNFNTSNVTNMSHMFYCCISLTQITLGSKSDLTKANFTDYNWTKYASLSGRVLPKTAAVDWATMNKAENREGIWVREGTTPDTTNSKFYEEYDSDDSKWTKNSDDTWSYTFDVVDENQTWYLWEDDLNGYVTTATKANPTTINGKQTREGTLTNVGTIKPASLKLTKTVTGKNVTTSDKDKSFAFNVTLTNTDETLFSGTKVYDDTIFNNGAATVYLKNGESKTISDLPAGTKYTVTEANADGFTSSLTNGSGTLTAGTTAQVTATNTKSDVPTTDVVLSKDLTSNYAGKAPYKDENFAFTVNLSGLQANQDYTLSNGTSYKSDAVGDATITVNLKAGSSVIIKSLPIGAKYKVSEAGITQNDYSYQASYTVTDANGKNSIKSTKGTGKVGLGVASETETADQGEAVTMAFTNKPEPRKIKSVLNLSVVKKASDTNEPLSDAVFNLKGTSSDGMEEVDINQITDSTGNATFKTISAGTYTLTETKAPDGFALDTTPHTITITENGVVTNATNLFALTKDDSKDSGIVTFEQKDNKATLGELKVKKVDSTDNSKALQNARFSLSDSNGKVIDRQQTNNDGIATFKNLAAGNYTLAEIAAPDGYRLSNQTYPVKVTINGNTATETVTGLNQDSNQDYLFSDVKETEVKFAKVDTSGDPLDGAKLELLDSSKQTVKTWTSTKDPFAIKLTDGSYILKEVEAPTGYETASEIAFTVKEGKISVNGTEQDSLTLTMTDHYESIAMPLTGQQGFVILLMAGVLVTIFAFAFALKRNDN